MKNLLTINFKLASLIFSIIAIPKDPFQSPREERKTIYKHLCDWVLLLSLSVEQRAHQTPKLEVPMVSGEDPGTDV